jgi:hypothetical protein
MSTKPTFRLISTVLETGNIDTSGVELFYTSQSREFELGVFQLGGKRAAAKCVVACCYEDRMDYWILTPVFFI